MTSARMNPRRSFLAAGAVRFAMIAALLGASATPALLAQSTPTAASITDSSRSLSRAIDGFFAAPAGEGKPSPRTLMLVLDPTTSVAKSGFAKEFAASLVRSRTDLANSKLGLFVVGRGVFVAPTTDCVKVQQAVAAVLEKPVDQPQNVFAAVREAAAEVAKGSGARQLFVVTLDHSEAEDDVEGTGQLLKKRGVSLRVMVPDACLADSYWVPGNHIYFGNLHRPADVAPGAEWVGGDAPLVDVPFGFLFQLYEGNLITPAGYAPYAWNRLVHLAGGTSRVVLHAGESNWTHHCILFGECLECGHYYLWDPTHPSSASPHKNHGEDFREGRLAQMAPPLVSRSEAAALLAKDPFARATQAAWRKAFDAGIVSGRPSIKVQGKKAVPETVVPSWSDHLVHGLLHEEPLRDTKKAVAKARDLAKSVVAIEAALERDLAAAAIDPENLRSMAIARYAQVMLLLTQVVLIDYQQYLEVELPQVLAKDKAQNKVGASLNHTEQSICHGFGMHLRRRAEGDPARPVLAKLAKAFDQFERDFAGSPIAFALKRMSLTKFEVWYPGPPIDAESPRPRLPGQEPGRPTTPPRPAPGRSGPPRTGPRTGG